MTVVTVCPPSNLRLMQMCPIPTAGIDILFPTVMDWGGTSQQYVVNHLHWHDMWADVPESMIQLQAVALSVWFQVTNRWRGEGEFLSTCVTQAANSVFSSLGFSFDLSILSFATTLYFFLKHTSSMWPSFKQ